MRSFIFFVFIVMTGCGFKAPPLPPETELPHPQVSPSGSSSKVK